MLGKMNIPSIKQKLLGDLSSQLRAWIALVSLFLFCLVLLRTAWIEDEANFTVRTVLNWINGYGPVFNVGERVQAYAHPLWFLVLTFFTLITNNVFFSLFFLSIGLSLISVWILIRYISTSVAGCLIAVTALLFSLAFIDYSSSGLENPLSHLLILLSTYYAFLFSKNPSSKPLFLFAIVTAPLLLTRQDLILCVIPLVVLIVFMAKRQQLPYLRAIALGLVPSIAWLIFSLGYYGFAFPNTAYANLGHGVSMVELVKQGQSYFLNSLVDDPITLFTIGASLVLAMRGNSLIKAIALGMVFYLVYIGLIGGDFLGGRFFTVPLIMACVIISRTAFSIQSATILSIALLCLAFLNAPSTVLSNYSVRGSPLILGEIDHQGQLSNSQHNLLNLIDRASFLYPKQPAGVKSTIAISCKAYLGISKGPALQLINPCGLSDPFISRLPARQDYARKIGYFERELPAGYVESVRTGQNALIDPATRNYYEYIYLITHGPLLSWERLKVILLVNTNQVPKPNPYLYQYGSSLNPVGKDEPIYFSKAGLTAQNLGWQTPEDWGTWSNGTHARLALALPEGVGKVQTLRLEMRAFVGGPLACQKVIISIHHQKQSESCLSHFENNTIVIPLSLTDSLAKTPLVIDFSLPNAISPKSLGVSPNDERVLAIGLKQAVFE